MSETTISPEETSPRPGGTGEEEEELARRQRRGGYLPPVRGIVPLIVLVVIWQLVGNPKSPYFPPPRRWWDAVDDLYSKGHLLPAVGATLEAFIISLVIATILGSAIGFSMGASKRTNRALSSTLEFLRSMPPAAVLPIFVLLIGYDIQMKVVVVVFAAIWPVLLSTRAAARSANPLLLDSARTLRLSRLERLWKVVTPSMLPSVLVGVQVAAPVTLIIVLLVEILTTVSGIGALLATAQQDFESAQVYGLVAVAGIIAVLINYVVVLIERYVTRYQPRR